MAERLIVIGGDAAGMSAASQARKRRDRDDLEILAFERGNFTSYTACGIPYWIGDTVEDLDTLVVRTPEQLRSLDIDVRMRTEVVAVDLDRRIVEARDLESGATQTEGFDHLVVATGAVPVRPDLPGAESEGIFGVQVLDDGVDIRRFIDANSPRRAVVVGGGYIGLEMAEAFAVTGLEVALLERARHPMTTLDPDMGALVAEAMRSMDIDLHLEQEVTGFDVAGGRVRGVATGDGKTHPADIVILGIGVRPNVRVADEAGVPIGPAGGIAVDRQMRTEADGVWAAGDCAEKFHIVARRPVAIPLGTHANKEGRVAGINLGGGYATFRGVVGTAVSKLCDVEVARTGLTESEAEDAGFEHLSATVESTTRAGYFPGASKLVVKVIVEARSGRLLGAQIVGREGAAKRIDVLACALWNEMGVDELQHVDLSYAPPFAPVWDPVLIAARKAWEVVEKKVREST